MSIKIITDYKNLKYFIIPKKLIRYQTCWAKFLFDFNFVIFYTSNKKNSKVNLLTYCLNNLLLSKNNDFQQHKLQTFLSAKKLEINLITKEKNITIIKQVVKIYLEDDYCSKLHNLLETGYSTKKIDLYYFSYLLINLKN